MTENFESKPKIEKGLEKTETDTHLEHLNPQLWQELSGLSVEQQDEYWFNLTQKHLKDYKEGKSAEEKFKLEELKFIFLNRLGEKNMPSLSPETVQRGFYFNPEKKRGQRIEKLGKLGNFIAIVQNQAEEHNKKTSRPFQVLIGGIGVSGKATIRNVLSKELAEKIPERKIISWDRDYQKLFPIPLEWQGDINIIEDVHGLDGERDENGKFKRFDGADGLVNGYDMVVYVLPSARTYKQSLIRRGMGWLRAGKLDLTASDEKQYAESREQKIKQTADELERFLPEAQKWFKEQLRVLRELKNRGIRILVVDPSEILKQLYNLEEKPELADKSFIEALEILSKE